ncbi:MAG: HWE histidine kinase domain-containing protein [Propylenella sp.]
MPEGEPRVAPGAILRLLRGASITLFNQDTDLRYRWLENPPAAWNVDGDVRGRTDADILPVGAAATMAAVKREVLSTGRSHWAEFAVDGPRSRQHFEFYVEAERDHTGAATGIVGLALDVTERRKRVAALEAIVRQTSHRSKNLLAILQSIAVQTARAAASTDEFVDQYRARIQSISRSQDLAIGPAARGVRLSSLIASQVEPYVVDAAERVAFEGFDCELSGNAALHIGLALSELTVAAVSLGALSGPDGRVQITAERVTDSEINAARSSLRLVWTEHAGRSLAPQGFALQLLERLIPAALDGHSALALTEDGIRYALTIASSEFE